LVLHRIVGLGDMPRCRNRRCRGPGARSGCSETFTLLTDPYFVDDVHDVVVLTQAKLGTTRSCCRCSTVSASPAAVRDGPGPGRMRCWRTRRTHTPRPGGRCASAGSPSSVPNATTRSPAASPDALFASPRIADEEFFESSVRLINRVLSALSMLQCSDDIEKKV
jgi:hypothetical protein